MQETLVSHFVLQIGQSCEDSESREIAGQAVKIYLDDLAGDKKKWKSPSSDYEEITRKFLKFYKEQNELVKIFRNLSNDRNDLNHAGHNDQPMKADKFKNNLSQFLNRIEEHIKIPDNYNSDLVLLKK